MARFALVLVVAACAIAALTSVDAVDARQHRLRRATRGALEGRSRAAITCSADAMARAMAAARAGSSGWWDEVKSGLGKAVDAVGDAAVTAAGAVKDATVVAAGAVADASVVAAGAVADASVAAAGAVADASVAAAGGVADAAVAVADAVNIVKAWECNRCVKCQAAAKDLSNTIIKDLSEAAAGAVVNEVLGGSLCVAAFDAPVLGLCSAICLPIPVPGVCPVVCPPFVVYAHTKCAGIIKDVVQEITGTKGLADKLKAKTLAAADVPALQPASICNKLSLCPLTRFDCPPEAGTPVALSSTGAAAPAAVASATGAAAGAKPVLQAAKPVLKAGPTGAGAAVPVKKAK